MTFPVAVNAASLSPDDPTTVTFMRRPRASSIWQASVRFQISS